MIHQFTAVKFGQGAALIAIGTRGMIFSISQLARFGNAPALRQMRADEVWVFELRPSPHGRIQIDWTGNGKSIAYQNMMYICCDGKSIYRRWSWSDTSEAIRPGRYTAKMVRVAKDVGNVGFTVRNFSFSQYVGTKFLP